MDSLRSFWNAMPALRLLLPFTAGIAGGLWLRSSGPISVVIAVVILLSALLLLVVINRISVASKVYRLRFAAGTGVLAAMASLGFLITWFSCEKHNRHDISHFARRTEEGKALYTAVVADPVVDRGKTQSALLQLKAMDCRDSSRQLSGYVLAVISKDPRNVALNYGDEIRFSTTITAYEAPKNPGEFDYAAYQALHHIGYRCYLQGKDWKLTGRAKGNLLLAAIYQLRAHFLSEIKATVSGTDELAVSTAILLGYRDFVTDEVMQAYAGSGVLHVLSVSGLHVAVLYYVLNLLLGWMDKLDRLKWLKGVLVIAVMLLYAVLTGLSPPVLRSVLMFTMAVLAGLLGRQVSIYNVIAVSCVLLLAWDPFYLADVGFQLSYLAVFGIVFLYPRIHNMVNVPKTSFGGRYSYVSAGLNHVLDFGWGLCAVSIAAQIVTLPLSLYYFHSFPVYFLPANLVVIPLSNLVLVNGMALFASGWNAALLHLCGCCLAHLLQWLNGFVFWVDTLPGALLPDLYITAIEASLLYALILMGCWFAEDRRPRVLLAGLLVLLCLCSSFAADSTIKDRQAELLVYSLPGKSALAFILNHKAYYSIDSSLRCNEAQMRYYIRGAWGLLGAEKVQDADSAGFGRRLPFGKLYLVKGRKVLMPGAAAELKPGRRFRADVLILSGNCRLTLSEILASFEFRQLVFDSSVKASRLKQWKEECRHYGLLYQDCRQGAFLMDL